MYLYVVELDPAIDRRLSVKLEVPLPDEQQRQQILQVILQKELSPKAIGKGNQSFFL